MKTQIVRSALHQRRAERNIQRLAKRGEILEENLFLEVLGAGGNEDALATEDGRDQVRQRLPRSRAGFHDQVTLFFQRLLYRLPRLGHRLFCYYHVALCLENSPRFLEVTWAAQRSGLVYTAINYHLTPDEVAYIVGDCDARAFVASAAPSGATAALRGRLPDTVHTRLAIGGDVPGFESYDDAIAACSATPLAETRNARAAHCR